MKMASRKAHGFVVVESCEDYEQVMALDDRKGLPPGGVLRWGYNRLRLTVFASRKDASAAIKRTAHYRRTYGELDGLAEAEDCFIAPVVMVEQQ